MEKLLRNPIALIGLVLLIIGTGLVLKDNPDAMAYAGIAFVGAE